MSVQKSIAGVQHETAPVRILPHAATRVRKFIAGIWLDAVALVVIGIVFLVPFAFLFVMAAKPRPEAALFEFSWPSKFQLFENIQAVMAYGNGRMILALWNSTILT